MKHKILLLLTCVVALVLTACATQEMDVVNPASTQSIDTIEAFGSIKSTDVNNVVLNFPASVVDVVVKEGQKVVKGQQLLLLDTMDYEAEIESKSSEINILKERGNKTKGQREQIDALEKQLQLLKSKINNSNVKEGAVINDIDNGIVVNIAYGKGDQVIPGAKALSLINGDTLYVEANVNEEFIKYVDMGAEVTIVLVADKSREYKGKVSYISNAAIKQNGQTFVPIHVDINEKDDFIKPYYNVDIKITKKK